MFSDTRKATPKAKRGYAVMPRLDPLMIHIDPYMIHLDHRMIIFLVYLASLGTLRRVDGLSLKTSSLSEVHRRRVGL